MPVTVLKMPPGQPTPEGYELFRTRLFISS